MNKESGLQKWTWADLLSTYRFWGLVLVYGLVVLAARLQQDAMFHVLASGHFAPDEVHAAMPDRVMITPFVFLLSWVVLRINPVKLMRILLGALSVTLAIVAVAGSTSLGALGIASQAVFLVSASSLLVIGALTAAASASPAAPDRSRCAGCWWRHAGP